MIKKGFIGICLLLAFASCSKSPEEKAKKLITDAIKETLYFPETFELTSFSMDSANAPFTKAQIYEVTQALKNLEEVSPLQNQESSSTECVGQWYTPKDEKEDVATFEEEKREKQKAIALREQKEESRKMLQAQLLALAGESGFDGFMIDCSYKANNQKGETVTESRMACVDPEFKRVCFIYDAAYYTELCRYMNQQFEKLISEAAEKIVESKVVNHNQHGR